MYIFTIFIGVIEVPYNQAWEVLSKLDFKWWNLVANSSLVTGTSNKELDATIKLEFKDGMNT